MLAFAVAIACPGLLKKEITEHFRKCILAFFIHIAISGYWWGCRFFTAISRAEVPLLVVEGKALIDSCPNEVKSVFDRPNGHAVRQFFAMNRYI